MAINWEAFYANGGYVNDNSDPCSYDDGEVDEIESLGYSDWQDDNFKK